MLTIDRLEQTHDVTDVVVLRTTGDPIALLEAFEDAERVVIVDAVISGVLPGTVRLWDGSTLDTQPPPRGSSHQLSIAETLGLARAMDREPASVTIVGIEVARVEHGNELSPGVDEGIDRAVAVVAEIGGLESVSFVTGAADHA